MKIVTEHVYPPIPDRSMDWSAATDNYEPGQPLEYGATEKEAVEALLDNHCAARGAETNHQGECRLCFADALEGEKCRAVP